MSDERRAASSEHGVSSEKSEKSEKSENSERSERREVRGKK